jgi:phenylacetic acid degradation operon negative regulatory protein
VTDAGRLQAGGAADRGVSGNDRSDGPRRSAAELAPDSRRWQNLLFTLFGTYVLPSPRLVWSGGLVHLLEDFGFSTAAARIALSRLVRKGFLTRVKEGRRVYFAMSPALERLLSEGEQRIFSFGDSEPVAEEWTLVSYSIPEELRSERDRLRKRLTFIGFGSIHDGFWFSPRDRVEAALKILDELGLSEHAEVFVGRPAGHTSVSALVANAWSFDRLNELYRAFVEEYAPYRNAVARRRLSDRDAFLIRTRIVHEFRRFVQLDPELPREDGQEWRRRAVETFAEVYGALGELAQSYFDRITSPAGEPRRAPARA